MGAVLMLVSDPAERPVAVAGRDRRREYQLVHDALGGELLDLTAATTSRGGRWLRRLAGPYVAVAVAGLRRILAGGVDVVVCDNENQAMVLAGLLTLLRRDLPLVTFGVYPASAKKSVFFRLPGVSRRISLWLPFATVQAERLVRERHVPGDRVRLLPSHVDAAFFDPSRVDGRTARPTPRPYVLAIGRQDRDYATLVTAAADLPADVVIDGSSAHSRSVGSLGDRPLPANVRLVRLDQEQLRAAYARAAVVTVPTKDNDIGSGSTSVLEAMAMGRPIVATRSVSAGDILTDRRAVLRDGSDRSAQGAFVEMFATGSGPAHGPCGFYVPTGDPAALHAALSTLLRQPDLAAELGRNGRALVDGALRIEHFVDRAVAAVRQVQALHQEDG